MIYVFVVIVVVVVVLGAVVVRRKTNEPWLQLRPDPDLRSGLGGRSAFAAGPGPVPEVPIPTPEYETEAIVHDEFVSDVSDDLLDPRNPHHAEWVKQHPEMETDAEWVAEHPEDNPA